LPWSVFLSERIALISAFVGTCGHTGSGPR
jgi:hypothetical protein